MAILDEAAMGPSRGSRVARDILWTALTSFVVLAGNAVLSALLARRGVTEVFEPYNLVKRLGAALVPVMTLGFTLGLARFLAAASSEHERDSYVTAAVGLCAVPAAIGTLALALAPRSLSVWILGEPDTPLLWVAWAYTVALTMNALGYAMYRGEMRQSRANVLNISTMVVVPLLAVLLAPAAVPAVPLLATVAAWAIAANGVLLLGRVARWARDASPVRAVARSLTTYSLPRIPSGLAVAGLLAAGPLLARRAGAVDASAYLLSGLMTAQLAVSALQAFSVVLLPRVSALNAAGSHDVIARLSGRMVFVCLCLGAVATPALVFMAPDLIPVWLGVDMQPAVATVQVVAISLVSVVMFSVMTSVTDAVFYAPVNAYAAVLGLFAGVGRMLLASPDDPTAIAWGYVIGQTINAAIVLGALWWRYRFRVSIAYPLAAALASWGVSRLVAGLLGPDIYSLLIWGVGVICLFGLTLWLSPEHYGIRSSLRGLVVGR